MLNVLEDIIKLLANSSSFTHLAVKKVFKNRRVNEQHAVPFSSGFGLYQLQKKICGSAAAQCSTNMTKQ